MKQIILSLKKSLLHYRHTLSILHTKSLAYGLVCLLLAMPTTILSQTIEQLYKAANESLKNGEYYAAAKYFKQAVEKDDAQPEIWYGFAEASRLFNDYTNAAKGYEQALKTDKENSFPLCNFWLGNMLINQGAYEAAKQHLTTFQHKYRKKDFYALKVQQLIESCAWALANDSVKPIEITHLPDSINSTFSELNPFISTDGKLYYSSTKPVKGKTFRTQIISAETGESFLPGITETSAKHIANGFFSLSSSYGKEVFFTQCHTESGTTRCKIFVSTFTNNQWGTAKELPVNINLLGYTATHPNIWNEPDGKQWLLFASNRPGTKGKMDIWISKRLNATEWDYPQNAGSNINSIDDEVTPFADTDAKQLYFASQWHYGYGAFDVFAAPVHSLSKAEFGKPINLGKPINSPANELYYAVYDSVAFFSSNRLGSKFIEAETCCNDIYAASQKSSIAKDTVRTQDTLVAATLQPLVTEPAITDTVATAHVNTTPDSTLKLATTPTETHNSSANNSLLYTHVTLYFHNDEPNPKTLADTTDVSYLTAYESYINKQQEYYKNNWQGAEKHTNQALQTWFRDTVEASFAKLVSVASQINKQLNSGKKITVKISGYCSPLHYNEYNIHLGNRRSASVFNFFQQYNNGSLLPFITNGNLVLERITHGEETAPKNISDALTDLRNSVYSLAAARERRVELSISAE
ncbi:MAG: hypothetical protein U0T72_06765 [Chitinophagales bacterium]